MVNQPLAQIISMEVKSQMYILPKLGKSDPRPLKPSELMQKLSIALRIETGWNCQEADWCLRKGDKSSFEG